MSKNQPFPLQAFDLHDRVGEGLKQDLHVHASRALAVKKSNKFRASPVFLAGAAGGFICLSVGNAFAVNGTIGPVLSSGTTNAQFAFGGKIKLYNMNGGNLLCATGANKTQFACTGTVNNRVLANYLYGNNCKNADHWWGYSQHAAGVRVTFTAPRYTKVRFDEGGGYKYGWLTLKKNASLLSVKEWSYASTPGAAILTQTECLNTFQFSLSNGNLKLGWSNDAEDGVATYIVQQRENGAWQEREKWTPGEGCYTLTAPAQYEYRLLIEYIDGSQDSHDFPCVEKNITAPK